MEDLAENSLDIGQEKLAQLKNLFPEVFSEDKIDFERLRNVLGEKALVQGEHYELSWAGKTEARKEIQKTTTATLVSLEARGKRVENSEFSTNPSSLAPHLSHLFIEGENLEVLRILQKSYFGKVKMIYIDPPYNTGNDSFVYPDSFAENLKDYRERTEKIDKKGNLNSLNFWQTNRKENGQFHSVWLSMMYPRLYLSRNLLKEEGVIFISIDDNEAANLKLLCDEVFGEENFVGQFIWQKTFAPKNDAKYISNSHESIFCYAKNLPFFERILLPRTEEANQSYTNPDQDKRGVWTSTSMLATSFSANYVFEIVSPNGKKHSPPDGRCWRYSQEKVREMIGDNRVWFGADGNNVPRTKRFLSEVQQGIVPQSLLLYKEVGSGQDATNHLKKLFDDRQLFDFSKPVALIKYFLKIASLAQENDIILDFFAGSGTTAQAVMELNEEDGGNRQFICVQMPEATDEKSEAYKTGYKTIADITKARIEKVITKIGKEREGKIDFKTYKVSENLISLACRHFVLAESNFKVWRSDIKGVENIAMQLFEHQQSEKPESKPEDMMLELCLKSGLGLNVNYQKEDGFYKIGQKIWFCFEKYTDNHKQVILAEKPEKLIFLNSCFENEVDLSNFQLALRENGIKLGIV